MFNHFPAVYQPFHPSPILTRFRTLQISLFPLASLAHSPSPYAPLSLSNILAASLSSILLPCVSHDHRCLILFGFQFLSSSPLSCVAWLLPLHPLQLPTQPLTPPIPLHSVSSFSSTPSSPRKREAHPLTN